MSCIVNLRKLIQNLDSYNNAICTFHFDRIFVQGFQICPMSLRWNKQCKIKQSTLQRNTFNANDQ